MKLKYKRCNMCGCKMSLEEPNTCTACEMLIDYSKELYDDKET